MKLISVVVFFYLAARITVREVNRKTTIKVAALKLKKKKNNNKNTKKATIAPTTVVSSTLQPSAYVPPPLVPDPFAPLPLDDDWQRPALDEESLSACLETQRTQNISNAALLQQVSDLKAELLQLQQVSDLKANGNSSKIFHLVLAIFLAISTAKALHVFREDWLQRKGFSWSSTLDTSVALVGFIMFTVYSNDAPLWAYLGLPVGCVYALRKYWMVSRKLKNEVVVAWVDDFTAHWESKDRIGAWCIHRTVGLQVLREMVPKDFPSYDEAEASFLQATLVLYFRLSKEEAIKWAEAFAEENWRAISAGVEADQNIV